MGEAGKAGMVAGQMAVAGPDNPLAHGGEGRQVRSAFSCVREEATDSQLATAMGLLFSAEGRGWGQKMETLLGFVVFSPALLLRSGLPHVDPLVCLAVISIIHLFSLFSAPTIFLELKCISYRTNSSQLYGLFPCPILGSSDQTWVAWPRGFVVSSHTRSQRER